MADVIIIGGGIIGMLTAHELHHAGVDVMVVERGPLGGESSWAGGGIISPLYPWRYSDAVTQLAQISQSIYPALVQQLLDESGVDCELIGSGLLFAGLREQTEAEEWAHNWSMELHAIKDQKLIHEIEPMVSPDIHTGLWLPDIRQVRNPKLVKALKGSFENLGIHYREHTPVKDLIIDNGAVKGVRTGGDKLTSALVIIASGAWSAGFIKHEQNVSVEPVKGQMIMFRGEAGMIRRMVLSSGHYIIPRRDGRVLAGSTLERTGFDKSTTESASVELRHAAIEIIPALADLEIERHWAGLRPGTHHGIPYICEHPDIKGLFVNAGHYRNGVVLGPASARLMAEMVQGRLPTLNPAPYALAVEH